MHGIAIIWWQSPKDWPQVNAIALALLPMLIEIQSAAEAHNFAPVK